MMLMRNVEVFLENHIEGFFNKKFSSHLQFAELEKRLIKEISMQKKMRQNRAEAPNHYTFQIAEADYKKMGAKNLRDRLYVCLVKTAIREKLFIVGKIVVEILQNADLKKGCITIASAYVENECLHPAPSPLLGNTLIFDKGLMREAKKGEDYKIASLRVIEGPDEGKSLDIGERRVHIGRRESNEFLIGDMKTSRLHAYISFENCRHVLYDAGSLNGTCINDDRIDDHVLNDGDEIKAGNTIILYEVN